MIKLLAASLCLFLMVGCSQEPTYSEVSNSYQLPSELRDCKMFKLTGDANWIGKSKKIYIVRCPRQTTTSESHYCGNGCYTQTNITVDNL